MPIIYVTTGAWGVGTGTPNSAAQVDGNFFDLHARVEELETNPPTAVGISNIQVEGSQLMIFLSDATEFGPFTLPIAAFEFRGEFVADATYFELDIISVIGEGLFMVRVDHTGVAPFDPARTISGDDVYLRLFGSDPFRYDFGPFIPGKVGLGVADNKRIWSHLLAQDVFLLADLPESRFELETAPAAELVIPIRRNSTEIGTLTWDIGEVLPVVDFPDDIQFTNIDRVSMMKPAAVDVTALELTATLVGRRGVITP